MFSTILGMGLLIVTILNLITIVLPHPTRTRLAREMVAPIVVQQTSEAGTHTTNGHTRECIDVQNANVPASISLNNPGNTYTLTTFSTECSEEQQLIANNVPLIDNAIVNKRTPICSFQLHHKTLVENPATVIFGGLQSTHQIINTLSDTGCKDICSEAEWVRFAQYLTITVNERPSSNYVNLFSDSNCQQAVATEIVTKTNLVKLTQHDPVNIVRSFRVDG